MWEMRGSPPTLVVEKSPGVFKTIKDANYTRILGTNIQANLLWNTHMESGEKELLPQVSDQAQ